MAQSRVYKVGTIYYRTKGLIDSGALKSTEIPLWYAVYQAFPPKYEPRFDREFPDGPVRKIFYKEDILRARFHHEYPKFSNGNMLDSMPSTTSKFMQICAELQQEQIPDDEIYHKALTELSKLDKTFTIKKDCMKDDPKTN